MGISDLLKKNSNQIRRQNRTPLPFTSKVDHSAPQSSARHVGDLGNILTIAGRTLVNIQDGVISLDPNGGPASIVGLALVVHAD